VLAELAASLVAELVLVHVWHVLQTSVPLIRLFRISFLACVLTLLGTAAPCYI